MADLATLQTRLLEAELAYHKLATGSKQVEVQHGDMKTKYSEADLGKLQAYINQLKAEIAQLGGAGSGLRRRGIVVDSPGIC